MLTLLFHPGGRLGRSRFLLCQVLLFTGLLNGFYLLDRLPAGRGVLACFFAVSWLYVMGVVCVKRMRDSKKSPWWLLLVLIPLVGPIMLSAWLLLGWGRPDEVDHYEQEAFSSGAGETVVNDVTQLNPVRVLGVFVPESVEQLQDFVRSGQGPLSIGGGRFSMGGQTSSPDSTFLDLRRLNRVIELKPGEKTVRVQPGVRWCDLQKIVDPLNLAIQVMQTYANFTVGGSLSVNAHGRYVGLGPLILSVQSLQLMLADGSLHSASPQENPHFFYGAVGCYGALGIVTEVTLKLAENVAMERRAVKLERADYVDYFINHVRNNPDAVFHNADLYPPHYERLLAVTWCKTDARRAGGKRLQVSKASYPIHRYFYWAVTETPLGTWRREHLFDPAYYRGNPIHWRNFEAGYDVRELEPDSRRAKTYVLQEYFIPVDQFTSFCAKMGDVLRRNRANVVNVSVRHALPDPGSYLAWAPNEVFAFVLYYKQGTGPAAREQVADWTRQLIEASLECQGRYYLPYQPHASLDQFQRAYPRAQELFELKRQFDPHFRFRNSLWNQYYLRSLHV